MLDIGISGAAPGADPSAAARTSRNGSDAGQGSGFSDALASAGDRGKKTADDDDGGNAASSDTSDASGNAGQTDPTTRPGIPGVDPRGSKPGGGASTLAGRISIRTLQADLQAATSDAVPLPAGTDAATTPAPVPPGMPVTDAQLEGAALAAALAAEGTDGDANADVPAGAGSGDDAGPAPTGSDGKGAVSDTLTLLDVTAGQTLATPPIAAAVGMVVNAQTTSVKQAVDSARTAKGDTTDSLAALAARSASDADAEATVQTVKITRPDGRGAAFELSISGKKDESADLDVTGNAGANVDVTVLDSRRYLGLAAGTNSATVLGTLGGNSDWSAAMSPSSALSNQALWTSTGKVVNTLKIQLHPQDLGTVTATMRLSGDQLSVDLKVQSGEAYRQLSGDQGHMIEALRSQGYAVDRITVTLAASPDSGDGGSQAGFQGQQQAMANQGQGGGEAQTRRQGYSGQQANGNDGGWSSRDADSIDGAGGSVQRARAGGVYL